MSTYLRNNPHIASTGCDAAPEMKVYPEAASQSYKAGQLVYLVSGAVTVCGSDPSLIMGIAAKDATGTTSADAPIYLLKSSYKLKVKCYSTSGAAVQTSDNATIGTAYGYVVASNIGYLDIDDTTNDVFIVTDQITEADGDYTYFVECQVDPAVLQFLVGA